ncbi:phosphotransferase enzyme family protein [Ornithinibacillus halotolerans]|uniref:Aminoglycoside phosphotransferase domain-containing protein n=1 Tax=Ornithinibacillus halotolerans TaxID=1274357 RepID=A0A916WCE8_9BACI|nr:phosphotransferase [Ornithinibacillus halotolerans]GGA85383.1 hypothetical protein GCM10008025_30520 [Ornithinibacillus halotolerans]
MMKLSTMYDFLESESPIVLDVLQKWGFDDGSVGLVRASSNFIFIFKKDGTEYILRLTPHGDLPKIKNELNFLLYLRKNNVHVNYPIISREGNTIEIVPSALGTFYAVVFNFVEGKQYELEELSDEQLYKWGKALGNLHHNSKQYNSYNNDKKIYTLQDLLPSVEESIPSQDVSSQQEFKEIKSWIENLNVTCQNYGRIHFDFELDNLIWDENNIKMIDFESSIDGWYAADIAFALRDVFAQEVDFTNPIFLQFLNGYKSKTNITDDEVENISMFLRLYNLLTYTKLLDSLDLESNTKYPEWVVGLINKLQSKIEDYQGSFRK